MPVSHPPGGGRKRWPYDHRPGQAWVPAAVVNSEPRLVCTGVPLAILGPGHFPQGRLVGREQWRQRERADRVEGALPSAFGTEPPQPRILVGVQGGPEAGRTYALGEAKGALLRSVIYAGRGSQSISLVRGISRRPTR